MALYEVIVIQQGKEAEYRQFWDTRAPADAGARSDELSFSHQVRANSAGEAEMIARKRWAGYTIDTGATLRLGD